jgi:hypothetical protein
MLTVIGVGKTVYLLLWCRLPQETAYGLHGGQPGYICARDMFEAPVVQQSYPVMACADVLRRVGGVVYTGCLHRIAHGNGITMKKSTGQRRQSREVVVLPVCLRG